MCHGTPSKAFPEPAPTARIEQAGLEALVFGREKARTSVAIIPDIYGCNPFYQGFATHLADKGARVYLVNPFADIGELPEVTREAAFARRRKLRDKAFVDRYQAFTRALDVNATVGFCLGGYYVFELARRNADGVLVGFYGFPQGMDNEDPLPVPFEYLPDVTKEHLMLMPGKDQSVGEDNVRRLADLARGNSAIRLQLYRESGHGFLKDLDSDDPVLRENAEDALRRCERALGV